MCLPKFKSISFLLFYLESYKVIIVLYLQLSGYYLDVDDKPGVNEVFRLLEGEAGNVQGNLKNLFKSVVELRANNWGHTTSQSSTTNGYLFMVKSYRLLLILFNISSYQEMNGFLMNNQENGVYPNEADMSAEDHEFLASCEEYNAYLR